MILKKILILTLSIFCINSYAQDGLAFKKHKKLYLKGHSELIGNNILSVHKNKPFNTNKKINDILDLKYIDVDNNKSTFSSSEANLKLHAPNKTIKYAGLYWSAVYKYDKGTKGVERKRYIVYEGDNKRDTIVNNILFKTPNTKEYQFINGEVIYDSYNTKDFKDTKPYVCFADVTSLLKKSKSINGTYAIANIKATQGFVSGGCAGGWLLYVIYEDETETPKYFTTYNGFKAVDEDTVDIDFTGFKTNEDGEINTSLCLGVLEGDQTLKTDMCLILKSNSKSFLPLSNKLRPAKNFFNGKITQFDTLYTERNPNSSNTLGFDVLKINIPNKNNTIISNNQTKTTIRLKTKADGFNLFFVAFETEISPLFLETKTNEEKQMPLENTVTIIKEEIKVEKPIKVAEVKNEALTQEAIINKEVNNEAPIVNEQILTQTVISIENDDITQLIRKPSVFVPNLKRGYYIITNVFSVSENANKWISYLKQKGYNANSYINPENNWTYIYIKNSEDENTIIKEKEKLSLIDDFKNIWIAKINY